jgi:TM2 domain-containing membrane protein YozV
MGGASPLGHSPLSTFVIPSELLHSKKNSMTKEKEAKRPMPPIGAWAPAVALGWLIPGAGHLLLKKTGRGVLLLLAVTGMFVCGLMMRGAMFQPQTGDLLTTLINTGGFIGDVCSGLLYLLSVWLGYSQPDMAGHVHDYGTKFLVAAGLLNILAMVDAFDIAAGRKD